MGCVGVRGDKRCSLVCLLINVVVESAGFVRRAENSNDDDSVPSRAGRAHVE